MMNTFAHAVATVPTEGRTENGMKTNESSMDANVDLFCQIGASRGKDLTAQFEQAYQADRVIALRILAWARDVRGGAGERDTYRKLLQFVEQRHPLELAQMVDITPVVGRWDDLFALVTPAGQSLAYAKIKHALLVEKDSLCAKWCPRKGPVAVALTRFLGVTPKVYRKLVVGLTNVVETAMCANNWSDINYNHVPSIAASRYQKAFGRHDATGYSDYKTKLASGEAKINAGAIHPHSVVKNLLTGDAEVAVAQWNALPNYIGDQLILPMVDVSGSMTRQVGGSDNLTCMEVAVALGLYIADKNSGPYKDMFLTFSEDSRINVLKGDLRSKVGQLRSANWGMNTNLCAAFAEVLRVAKAGKVAAADMPKYILILSDMEFDRAVNDNGAIEMIREQYADANYELPNVVFWNLNARPGNSPVTARDSGVALVSGFSPAIMEAVLSANAVTPRGIMIEALNNARYSSIF